MMGVDDVGPMFDAWERARSSLGVLGRCRARIGIVIVGAGIRVVPDVVLVELAAGIEEAIES